ncbi:MAG TPA: hypothetical protein VG253_08720 [Streptosporangiaceae bacterium]|nr:hypothetical protein [Streptosporangiaceae bacterium]
MSSVSESGTRASGKRIGALILGIIGVIAVIVAIFYFVEPAKSLPAFLGQITHPATRASATRPLRGGIAIVVGVILLVGAWWLGFGGRSKASSGN